jgi:hypothetical protein
VGDCERWRPLSACVRPACIDSPAHTRPLRTYLPAPNSFRIHTSEKCPKSRENRHSKPFRIRTCKHLYLQVLWNPHLQKYRGGGVRTRFFFKHASIAARPMAASISDCAPLAAIPPRIRPSPRGPNAQTIHRDWTERTSCGKLFDSHTCDAPVAYF